MNNYFFFVISIVIIFVISVIAFNSLSIFSRSDSEVDFSSGDKLTVPLIGFDIPLPRIISHTETIGSDPVTETIEVPKMTSKNTPKLKSVTKKAGGSFNSGPNKKPSSGNKGKGGGGKGGGGGKAP